MVGAVYGARRDAGWLAGAFPALEAEHAYWSAPPKGIVVAGPDGRRHRLSRYYADTTLPRPESYRCAGARCAAGLQAKTRIDKRLRW